MSQATHLEALRGRHRALDDQIQAMQRQPAVDDLELAGLKKKKLGIKEEIARLEN